MLLGIHWLTDVIAGIVLGSAAVYVADFLVERTERVLLRRRRRARTTTRHSD